jgi:predicted lipoprotein with Yx(FWY)xxD motif
VKRFVFVVGVVAFAACAAACSGSSTKSSTSSPGTGAATTTVPPYDAGVGSTATPGANSKPTLQIAMNAQLRENVIVDSAGKTVYIYVPDGSSATSKVPASLQTTWPEVPAPLSTTPSVGTGLSANKLTVNPARQVAYNGHLLYTFKGDARAGVANGQGLGKVWYVMSPTGTPIT